MPIHILPFRQDLRAFCAEVVVSDLAEQLPDLSNAIILVPETTQYIRAQFTALRKFLFDYAKHQGHDALITPIIATPNQFFSERCKIGADKTQRLRAWSSLATAFYKYKNLFPHASRWQLADEAILVFDKISEYEYADEHATYNFAKSVASLAPIWQDDTRMLMTLWHTWKNLYNEKNYAPFAQYRMLVTDTHIDQREHIYLCGIKSLSPCFEKWACNLYNKGRLTWITKANASPIPVTYHPLHETLVQLSKKATNPGVFPDSDTHYSRFLDQVFSTRDLSNNENIPFAERARQFAQKVTTSPVVNRVRLFFPCALEDHAWGIYIAIRQWLADKHQSIALVSLDRRLSRRIRTIFERFNIPLIDYSGWELSTTSSATAFKHLLTDVDDPPTIKMVLALMRSPFCNLGVEHGDAITAANDIEYQIGKHQIQYRSLEKTLAQLKKVIGTNSLSITLSEKIITALSLLEKLKDSKEHPYTDYFEALFKVMKKLGMYQNLAADAAGEKLISEIQKIYNAVKVENEQAYFNMWHSLILHHMENSNFIPDCPDHGVFLMNPAQAELMNFDALAIIALDHSHFPSQPQSGLINENIRREFGLETYEQSVGKQFLLFRTLLESSKHLLLSCQQHKNNRKLAPSAWLTAIHHFHKIAYDDLTDTQLQDTARLCSALNLSAEQGLKPQIQTIASPISPRQLWPRTLSVNAYQNIIDCPYLFFARYLLKIQSRPKISSYWESMHYGIYLHQCLHKLHNRLDDLYDPPIWLAQRRVQIVDEAQHILETQFNQSASDNYINYFWLADAKQAMTYYIDWMLQQKQAILSTQTEQKLEQELAADLSVKGRADLILQTKDGYLLIDYKTGPLVRAKDIQSGEHIQLISYALLDSSIKSAIYLGLGANSRNKGEQRVIPQDKLTEYRDKNLQRILDIKADYDTKQPLHAWGHKQNICRYCDYAGLCRRPAWDEYHDWES